MPSREESEGTDWLGRWCMTSQWWLWSIYELVASMVVMTSQSPRSQNSFIGVSSGRSGSSLQHRRKIETNVSKSEIHSWRADPLASGITARWDWDVGRLATGNAGSGFSLIAVLLTLLLKQLEICLGSPVLFVLCLLFRNIALNNIYIYLCFWYVDTILWCFKHMLLMAYWVNCFRVIGFASFARSLNNKFN